MPQPITTAQLQNLQDAINSGGVAAVIQAYAFLDSQGYAYGGWARGVAAGDSISGQSALSYLQGTALMGMGGEACRHLNQQQIDAIRMDMAIETLEKYKTIAQQNQGLLDRDLKYQETKDIHEKVFTDHHLSLDNWTLNAPMELIRAKYGEQAVEDFWRQLRDTGGDGSDAAVINSMLVTFMAGAQFSGNASVRQTASAWMDRFSNIAEWSGIIANAWSRNVNDAYKTIKDTWVRAKVWAWPRDPILLDLDGDGLETVGVAANIYFDHDADGVLTNTGWVGKDDALLVWDRNANGSIDTGTELFGDFTPLPNGSLAPNGFAALAALDANGDGMLDARDPAFAELRLWRDASQDGQSDSGELISLAEAGIVSMSLTNTLKNQLLTNGNTFSREGSFQRADGSTGGMGEFKLASDTYATRFAQIIEVPEALETLPDLSGSGTVRELKQAASQSTDLANVLSQFQQATTRTEQLGLLDQLLAEWADTSSMAHSLEERAAGKYRIVYEAFGNERRSANIDAAVLASVGTVSGASLLTDYGNPYLSEHYRQLMAEWRQKMHVLEALNGQYFFNLPAQNSQTAGANWGLAIRPGSTAGSGGGTGSASVAIDALPTLIVNFSQPQLDLLQQSYASLRESVYAGLVVQTRLRSYLDQIELVIDDNGVRIDISALDRKLAEKRVTDPENYLADLLELTKYAGGVLARTRWSGLADLDSLIESLPQTAGMTAFLEEFNVRVFTGGDESIVLTDKADIALAGDGADRLSGRRGNDALFGQGGRDLLRGGDGDDLLSGGSDDDHLSGDKGNDKLFGQGGHDALYGGDGDDQISGGSDDDVLFGSAGHDVLDGGSGNDQLYGGLTSGNRYMSYGNYPEYGEGDVYRFGRGDGHDRIVDYSWQRGQTDRIDIKAGITPADVRMERVRTNVWDGHVDGDLKLTLRDTGETLLVSEHFDQDGGHAVEEIAFADGTVWTADTIMSLSLLGEVGNDELRGFNERNDLMEGGSGNDRLTGLSGDDTLAGDAGDDVLEGGADSDTYRFGLGDGQDVITEDAVAGDDVVELGEGVAPADLTARFTSDGSLTIGLPDGSRLIVRGQLGKGTTSQGIEQLRFVDGTIWGAAELTALALKTTAGDDDIVSGEQDDSFDGGAGNDRFEDRGGYDTYRFGPGDGQDLVDDDSGRIQFKEGIDQNDLTFTRDGGDLIATLPTGDAIRIPQWTGSRQCIDRFEFANGATLSAYQVQGKLAVNPQSEILFGSPGTDILDGSEKNSELYGEAGDDVLAGGAGSDWLHGHAGDDVLDGGPGNDVLEGGSGNNRYIVSTGMGLDRVRLESGECANDTVVFAPGIRPEHVSVQLGWNPSKPSISHGELVLGIGGNDAMQLRFNNDGGMERSALRKFIFDDGTEWTLAEAIARADGGVAGWQTISPGDPTSIVGSEAEDGIHALTNQSLTVSARANNDFIRVDAGNDRISAGIGDDRIAARAGEDLIAPEAGDDYINAGVGDDVILFNYGDGSDKLKAGDGTDTLSFGATIRPDMLSAAIDRSGQLLLLVDAGKGGMITLEGTQIDRLPGNLERIQFIGADGSAQIFDFAGWLRTHAASLPSATVQNRRAFDATEFELTGTVAPAGGAEAVAYAQYGDLLAQADIRNGTTSDNGGLLYGTYASDTLMAGEGGDVVLGMDGDDVIVGGSLNDLLHGGWGADRLHGGAGDDRLFGGWGGDTYVVQSGNGRDVIDDEHRLSGWVPKESWLINDLYYDDDGIAYRWVLYGDVPEYFPITPGGDVFGWFYPLIDDAPNILEFGPGIRPEDLRYSEQNGDLLIEFGQQSGNQVILRGYDASRVTRTRSVDIIRFTDGTEIAAGPIEPPGKTVLANGPGTRLEGGRFADTLIGTDGDDRFSGNGGADKLMGGAGSDTYRIGKMPDSRAVETVIVETWREEDRNRIEITGPIEAGDLQLQFDGRDLLLQLTPQGDVIRFAGFDPRAPGMQPPVSEISLLDQNIRLTFDDLREEGLRLIGASGNELVSGTAQTDDGFGEAEDDLVEAAQGGDRLAGGAGNDVYLVKPGDGSITIDDIAVAGAGNLVRFGPGIDPESFRNNLRFEDGGQGAQVLLIAYGGEGDVLRLTNFTPDDVLGRYAIEHFEFADGTVVDYATLVSWTFVIEGDNEDNALTGTSVGDRLYGYDGEDVLASGDGEDVLTGGLRNDVLRGGDGRDAYVVNAGDGDDIIQDAVDDGIGNVLRFGAAISRDDLRVEVDDTDLLIHFGSQGDVVRVSGQGDRGTGGAVIDTFEFADGTTVTLRELLNRAPRVSAAISDQRVNQDVPFSLKLPEELFIDPDGDELLIRVSVLGKAQGSVPGSPPPEDWLQYDAASRILYGTPRSTDVGEYDVFVQAMDGLGASSLQSFRLSVQNTNHAPVQVHPLSDVQLAKRKAFSWQVPPDSFRDIDHGDTLSYTATLADGKALPQWLKFDRSTQIFSGIVPANAKGSIAVRITASDGHGESSTATDVFLVGVTSGKSASIGNEGLGNGSDRPPPGHTANINDGRGTSPGEPGRRADAVDHEDLFNGALFEDDPLGRFLQAYRNDPGSSSDLISMEHPWTPQRQHMLQHDVFFQTPALWNDGHQGADPLSWSGWLSGASHSSVNGIEPKSPLTSGPASVLGSAARHRVW